MTNIAMLNKIKRLTISALVADDILMGILVLKGGNALDLVYDITNRGSIDIDFSMEKDFTDQEKKSTNISVTKELKILKVQSYMFTLLKCLHWKN